MESKLSQLDFERIIKQLLLEFGLNLVKTSTRKNGRELITINIVPITAKIEKDLELSIKSNLKEELEKFTNKKFFGVRI